MSHVTSIRRTGDAVHPDWCQDHRCTVEEPDERGYAWGLHTGVHDKVLTALGTRWSLGLTREHVERRPCVLVQSDTIDAEDNEHTDLLEPEEARHLARLLIEAADWCEVNRLTVT